MISPVISLTMLRQEIENDTGQSLQHLRLDAGALLDDFCQAIGLTEQEIRYVLGTSYDPVVGEAEETRHATGH